MISKDPAVKGSTDMQSRSDRGLRSGFGVLYCSILAGIESIGIIEFEDGAFDD